MEEKKEFDDQERLEDQQVPEVVKEEPDDKPAGINIIRSVIIAIIILAIIYFVYLQMMK
ncbi:hypothetical protein [Sphingobacterium humi]|uniref:Uncharacterized protein n=1 Tax=Sphingobacterium humi TaxID=1796905 RepID=A0A6N8L0X2_9SPHI|nr:hypothetical protein [Sphingobacterium humi]MVZ62649.1 hypothetical protein [Sphingobacterium humi]